MIFVDSNIPMYVNGAEHPNKKRSIELLSRLASEGRKLVTNTEVMQEIMHRYAAIGRHDAIAPVWDFLDGIVEEIFPVEKRDVLAARDLLSAHPGISARDAIHAAHCKRYRFEALLSFDNGFDRMPFIRRLS